MTSYQRAALIQMIEHPAQVGRWCGYTLLTDELHGEWMRQILSGKEDMTLQAHRGSYKTTCVALVLAILTCTDGLCANLFMRKTDDDVKEVIRQVQMIVEGDVFRALTERIYGEPVRVARANATELTFDTFAAPRGSAQLLGIGTKGSLTGKHFDRIFTDDIVNLQDRTSRAERERTKRVYQELQNIRNRGGRIINTGTPWHKEDAFTLMPGAIRYDCYQTGLIEQEKLNELRKSMSPSLFAANYELRHIASENALFDTTPVFGKDEAMLYDGIAQVDAAYGGEDYTALTCGRRVGDKLYLYGRLWRTHVDTVIDAIVTECQRLRCAPVYCEANADKGYLAKELRRKSLPTNLYQEKQNKYLKISTYLRKWWTNIVWLDGTDANYLNQIMDYTEEAEHDDAPDSAAVMCRTLDRGRRESLII